MTSKKYETFFVQTHGRASLHIAFLAFLNLAKSNTIYVAGFCIAMIFIALQTFSLSHRWGDVDSLALPVYINKAFEQRDSYFDDSVFNQSSPSYLHPIKIHIRNNYQYYQHIEPIINFIIPYISGSIIPSTTMAPLAAASIATVMPQNAEYKQYLFYSRLPTTIAFLLAVMIWGYIFWRLFHPSIAILAVCILGLSLPSQLMATSAMTYSYGQLYFALLALFCGNGMLKNINLQRLCWLFVLLAIAIYFNYQNFFIAVAFIASLVLYLFLREYNNASNKQISEKILATSILIFKKLWLPVGIFIMLITPALLWISSMDFGAPIWALGEYRQFSIASVDGIGDFIRFFAVNSYITITTILAFFTENTQAASIAYPIVYLATVLPVLYFLWQLFATKGGAKNHSPNLNLLLFVSLFCILQLVLVLIGYMHLGPSRHYLVFAPLMLLSIASGLNLLRLKLAKAKPICLKNIVPIFYCGLGLVIILGYFVINREYIKEVNNTVTEEKIRNVMEKYNVETVFALNGEVNSTLNLMSIAYTEGWQHFTELEQQWHNALEVDDTILLVGTTSGKFLAANYLKLVEQLTTQPDAVVNAAEFAKQSSIELADFVPNIELIKKYNQKYYLNLKKQLADKHRQYLKMAMQLASKQLQLVAYDRQQSAIINENYSQYYQSFGTKRFEYMVFRKLKNEKNE